MGKSTRRAKPKKPYTGFPLFPHSTGYWAKKIRQKTHYFGRWEDPDSALTNYEQQKADLHAGRTPRPHSNDLTLAELCNRFLTAKRRRVDAGEIGIRTFDEYHLTAKLLVDSFGRTRPVDALTAEDFEGLRASIAPNLGPVRLGKYIQLTRTIFKYGYESGLLDKPVRYGPEFTKPSKRDMRKVRQSKPLRMFEANEILVMLESASAQLKAMILVGINCAFGNTDVANLPQSAIDFSKNIVEFPRPKTAIQRRSTLWKETEEAIKHAISVRPEPKLQTDEDLVFITKHGYRWMRATKNGKPINSVGHEMDKLLVNLGIKREGVSFYALRHTFETIGSETLDQAAVDRVMGHERDDMPTRYRQRIEDERLKRVTDHVHEWLYQI